MDPEKADKALAAVAKALGLDEGADRETMLKALDAIMALKEALSGEKPKDEPAPAEEPAPEAEAAVAAASAEEATPDDAEVVQASDTVELMEDASPEAALAGEALAAVGMVAEATGMSPEEVVAALREKADAVGAALAGGPADGTPADAPMSSRDKEAADVALSAAKARQVALTEKLAEAAQREAKLASRLDEMQAELDARLIDEAIARLDIKPVHRSVYLKLAKYDRAEFKAELARFAENPEIPRDDVVVGTKAPKVTATADSVDPQSDDERHLVTALRAAKISEGRIAKRLAKYRETQESQG